MPMPSRWPKRLMVSVSDETHDALQRIAEERATTVAALLREAAERFVRSHKTEG